MAVTSYETTFVKLLGQLSTGEKAYALEMSLNDKDPIKLVSKLLGRKDGNAKIAMKNRVVYIKTSTTLSHPSAQLLTV